MKSFMLTPRTMSRRLHRADGRPRWLGAIVLLACGLFVLSGCIDLPVPYHQQAQTYIESGEKKLRMGDYEGALADFDQVVRGYDESFSLGIDPLNMEGALLGVGYLNRGVAKGGAIMAIMKVRSPTSTKHFFGWTAGTSIMEVPRVRVPLRSITAAIPG